MPVCLRNLVLTILCLFRRWEWVRKEGNCLEAVVPVRGAWFLNRSLPLLLSTNASKFLGYPPYSLLVTGVRYLRDCDAGRFKVTVTLEHIDGFYPVYPKRSFRWYMPGRHIDAGTTEAEELQHTSP
jgi:hypothetical protein